MAEKISDVTVLVKDMRPIDLACTLDNEVLHQLCVAWTKRDAFPNQIMYLAVGEEHPRHIYFPISSLVGIESSPQLPVELFADPNRKEREDYMHLNVDPGWIDWVIQNEERGSDKGIMFRTMYDAGVDYDVACELMDYEPARQIPITDRDDREPIFPLLNSRIEEKFRYESEYIELYVIDNFLDSDECENFENLIGDEVKRSTVFAKNPINEGRTSHTFNFPHVKDVDPAVRNLQKRVCDLLGPELKYIEALQCQIYARSEQFRAHQDYFSNERPPYQSFEGEKLSGQRQWSVVIYLTDAVTGSGTRFQRVREEFNPAKGTAIIWNNLYPSGNPNPYTLHAGLPAGEGKKLVLTMWVRRSE